jgi:hypothetical protein
MHTRLALPGVPLGPMLARSGAAPSAATGVARALFAALAVGLIALVASVDLPSASGGQLWSDGATYHAMASSLARDADLVYERADLERYRTDFPLGPQGLFLKRAKQGALYFGKAMTYPFLAAPFVAVLGTHGLMLTNVALLLVAVALAHGELARRMTAGRALAVTAALVFGTVAPAYVVWPTPEILLLTLALAGLVAWSRGRWLLSAVLIGVATYSKPTNLLLAIPLCASPLFGAGPDWLTRGLESARRVVVVVVTALALFGVNLAVTGEANYQGGERKTFYGQFPYEAPGLTFDTTGFWMTTGQLGPPIKRTSADGAGRNAIPRHTVELWRSFGLNLYYFWFGRFGGAIPYFLPVVVAGALFALRGPRNLKGSLALVTLLLSCLTYVWLIPDNWYGGSGTIGNRYFLSLLPLAVFFVPRGSEWVVAVSGIVSWLAFTGPIQAAPMEHALQPALQVRRAPFTVFPAELTMLNDLSIFNEAWRKKQPVGDVGGPNRRADPRAFFLYFLDDGTYGLDRTGEAPGFWLHGGRSAEVVLRALDITPIRRLVVAITGGPVGDTFTVRLGRQVQTIEVAPGSTRRVTFVPTRGVPYYETYLHTLRFQSARGAAPTTSSDGRPDTRSLGSWIEVVLDVDAMPSETRTGDPTTAP